MLEKFDRIRIVKKIDGVPYDDWKTDVTKFVIYEKDGKWKGVGMCREIAGIIDRRADAIITDTWWKSNTAALINAMFPAVETDYIKYGLTGFRHSYRNGRKERVCFLD